MRVINELDHLERDALKEKHGSHNLFRTHIEPVLNKPRCLWVQIFASDYYDILIHSGLPSATRSTLHPYQRISEALDYIKSYKDFLDTTACGYLNGRQVQYYLAQLNAYKPKLQDCFLDMDECFMLDKGDASIMRNEITDGMHRLVAYGLASELKGDYFPIPIVFGTDKMLQTMTM